MVASVVRKAFLVELLAICGDKSLITATTTLCLIALMAAYGLTASRSSVAQWIRGIILTLLSYR